MKEDEVAVSKIHHHEEVSLNLTSSGLCLGLCPINKLGVEEPRGAVSPIHRTGQVGACGRPAVVVVG